MEKTQQNQIQYLHILFHIHLWHKLTDKKDFGKDSAHLHGNTESFYFC